MLVRLISAMIESEGIYSEPMLTALAIQLGEEKELKAVYHSLKMLEIVLDSDVELSMANVRELVEGCVKAFHNQSLSTAVLYSASTIMRSVSNPE